MQCTIQVRTNSRRPVFCWKWTQRSVLLLLLLVNGSKLFHACHRVVCWVLLCSSGIRVRYKSWWITDYMHTQMTPHCWQLFARLLLKLFSPSLSDRAGPNTWDNQWLMVTPQVFCTTFCGVLSELCQRPITHSLGFTKAISMVCMDVEFPQAKRARSPSSPSHMGRRRGRNGGNFTRIQEHITPEMGYIHHSGVGLYMTDA